MKRVIVIIAFLLGLAPQASAQSAFGGPGAGSAASGSGGGSPTFPLLAPNGSAAAPSYSFSTIPTAGLYASGSSVFLKGGTPALNSGHFEARSASARMITLATNGAGITTIWEVSPNSIVSSFSGATTTTPLFNLVGNLASNTFLSFTNVATPAKIVDFFQDASDPRLVIRVLNGANVITQDMSVSGGYWFATSTNGTDTANISATAGSSALIQAVGAGSSATIQVFPNGNYDMSGSDGTGNVVSEVADVTVPSLTTTVTDGTNTLTVEHFGGAPQFLVTASDANSVGQLSIEDNHASLNANDLGSLSSQLRAQPTFTRFQTTDGTGTVANTATVRGFHQAYAGNVASAATITPRGNVFHITGTTNIDTITATTDGTCYTLIFDDALTVSEAGNISLDAPFVSSAGDTLTLCHDGTTWFETGRKNEDAIPTSPTCTGIGTGTTAMDTGSTDSAGTFVLSPAGAPATSGGCTATFSSAVGTNTPVCIATLFNVSGSVWDTMATWRITNAMSTTTLAIGWANNAVALTAGGSYKINYICMGK